MVPRMKFLSFGLVVLFGILSACRSLPTEPGQEAGGTPAAQSTALTATRLVPAVQASATPTPLPPSPTPTPTLPCSPEVCAYHGHFWLQRPIAAADNDDLDSTYRYGSTQEGARPVHHGVEFVNQEGTPVLAAAEGLVIVAGNDYQETYADYPFYYGNLVIVEHRFPGLDLPVFSLYGHLSAVQTQAGAYVHAGDQVGAVGYTGVAEWSHLHFEVRIGENTYRDTRNPELWLQPHENENHELNGVIAGQILNEYGTPIYIPNVVVERLGPGEEVLETLYVETYADFSLNGDDDWEENFVLSDLAPGIYRVSFVARGLQTWDLNVYPGKLTLLKFDAREP